MLALAGCARSMAWVLRSCAASAAPSWERCTTCGKDCGGCGGGGGCCCCCCCCLVKREGRRSSSVRPTLGSRSRISVITGGAINAAGGSSFFACGASFGGGATSGLSTGNRSSNPLVGSWRARGTAELPCKSPKRLTRTALAAPAFPPMARNSACSLRSASSSGSRSAATSPSPSAIMQFGVKGIKRNFLKKPSVHF